MGNEISEMFAELSISKQEFYNSQDGYLIFVRAEGYHNGFDNENTDTIVQLHDLIKNGASLKEARKETCVNFKEAKKYIETLNTLYVLKTGKPFYDKQIKGRKRKSITEKLLSISRLKEKLKNKK